MANFQFFKENLDKFVQDAKVQVESLQNDIKVLPETVQQILANSQVLLGEARVKFEALSDEVIKGDFLKKDYRPEIEKVVVELQTSVSRMFDSIKDAINKAK